MKISIHSDSRSADEAAAALLTGWIPGIRTLMVASGNTPLELYRRVGENRPAASHLEVFALDEYVGVPLEEPRNCANFLHRTVVQAWGVPDDRFHRVSSLPESALASVQEHERRIAAMGGLDAIILGLGQNGHLGFNEPGSSPDTLGRVLDLEPISVEANRKWFGGDFAPAQGVTVGLQTILGARRVLIQAYGTHKTAAAQAMVQGPISPKCPASYLQNHPNVHVFLDPAAAGTLSGRA